MSLQASNQLKRIVFALLGAVLVLGFWVMKKEVWAQAEVPVNVDVDLTQEQRDIIAANSTIEADPTGLYPGSTSTITVTIRNLSGNPIPGVSVQITGVSEINYTLTQPTAITNADGQVQGRVTSSSVGQVRLCAEANVYGYEITLRHPVDVIFSTVKAPVLNEEPEFTQGLTNSISWQSLSGYTKYYAQKSTSISFDEMLIDTDWEVSSPYTFTGLRDGVKYYYRIRTRNVYGMVGPWSNIVASTQDNSAPTTAVASVVESGDNFDFVISASDTTSGFVYATIYMKKDGGTWESKGRMDGATVTLPISDFSGFNPATWDGRYCFYSEGVDNVGNIETAPNNVEGDFCFNVAERDVTVGQQIVGEVKNTVVGIKTTAKKTAENVTSFVNENQGTSEAIVAVPAATAMVSTFSSAGFTFFDFGNYIIRFFMWVFGIISNKPKAQPWGFVYNSITKAPVSRAVVRLFSNGKLEDTDVTDINGVFYFAPKPGEYKITVSGPGFRFPSNIVAGTTDGFRKNIYKGDLYVTSADRQSVKLSIPLDPVSVTGRVLSLRRIVSFVMSFLVLINPFLLFGGVVASLLFYLSAGGLLNIVFFFINVLLFFLQVYLRSQEASKWGSVKDQQGKVLKGVEVGLYDTKYNKLIDSRITDNEGRFQFIVPGGRYLIKPVGTSMVIVESEHTSGYLVGEESRGDILVKANVILRSAQAAN